MATNDTLLKVRFLLNMERIHGLTRLVFLGEDLKPTAIFRSEGLRADILRSIVVFLHATFEVVLRSHLRKPNTSLSFYSSTDLDKALKLSGIDAAPFRSLYPPLIQMAKRRNRIVHEADLSSRTNTVSEVWGITDDWQLIMWLMAVPAFYYQLRMFLNVASEMECKEYEGHVKAMRTHVEFGNQLLEFPNTPPATRIQALQRSGVTLKSISAMLNLKENGVDPDAT